MFIPGDVIVNEKFVYINSAVTFMNNIGWFIDGVTFALAFYPKMTLYM